MNFIKQFDNDIKEIFEIEKEAGIRTIRKHHFEESDTSYFCGNLSMYTDDSHRIVAIIQKIDSTINNIQDKDNFDLIVKLEQMQRPFVKEYREKIEAETLVKIEKRSFENPYKYKDKVIICDKMFPNGQNEYIIDSNHCGLPWPVDIKGNSFFGTVCIEYHSGIRDALTLQEIFMGELLTQRSDGFDHRNYLKYNYGNRMEIEK